MRTPPPLRSGSRTRSWGARGGGKAPASGGSVRRAGASLATVTGRQSGAVDAEPFTMRRMSRSAAIFAQPAAFDPGLGQHGREQRRAAPRGAPTALRARGGGTGLRRPPAASPGASCGALAVALQAVARQHGGPRPAGHDEGLRGDERREAARPLGQQVVEVEPEAAGLPPAPASRMRLGEACGLVGGALEDHVERMAGMGEGGVEAERGDVHEAVELFRAHHRAGPVEGAMQRDQRAVVADQDAAAAFQRHGRLGRQKALQRLAAQGPAQALQVVGGCGEGEGHDASVS